MLRNTIIVAAVVASFTLMCLAQAPAEQAAAGGAAKAKTDQALSHRVQVLLLEINAKAEHPKLTLLRAAAQSGKATAGLIAMTDELIAAGVGFTDCNVTTIIRDGDKARVQSDDEVLFEVMDEQKKVKEWKRLGYSLECGYWGSQGEQPSISLMFEYSQAPRSKQELPEFSGRKTLRWSGLCSRDSGTETVLMAETPRKSGNSGGDVPIERYLLLRVDAVE